MKAVKFLSVVFIIISVVYCFPGEKSNAKLDDGINAIESVDTYNFCKELSSSRFAGRLTGHEGYTAAARWVADYFKKWGLKPYENEDGYLQAYQSPYVIIDKAEMTIYADGNSFPLTVEKDFMPLLYSDSGSNKAPVVFAGWGIKAPELGYDDYAGIDVKGKFVLCFRGVPDRFDRRFTDHDQHRHRMQVAKELGAVGLIYIYPDPQANPNGDFIKGFTPALISYAAADRLLKEKGINASLMEDKLRNTKKPQSFSLNAVVDYRVQSRNFPDGIGYNVIGFIEGSDPELKKECVIIGAHLDHCGTHMGLMFPGADDNASGSAVVMEIAYAFSKMKTRPRRSVVFALFGGEELGLEGSSYMAEHFPSQFTKIDSMFNFDMVGEGDRVGCGLNANPPQFEKNLREANETLYTLSDVHYLKEIGVRSSDFAPFYLKGAICANLYSNGPHLNYHKSDENIYRINPEIMADASRLVFIAAYRWADR